jgi:D-tyrosyl-tRNA(Tyr) deacylase
MKALIQRVSEARVEVENQTVGEIGPGLLVLVCAVPEDDEEVATRLAAKIAKLRIFEDAAGKMNLSVGDIGGAALVVSQFTLAADTRKGNRPSFIGAAAPEQARALYERFAEALAAQGLPVERGRFGAAMRIHLINDGPVTIWLDSTQR